MVSQIKELLDSENAMRFGLFWFGISSLLLGVFMAVAPGTFFTLVGPYGARNDHFIHDTATFQIALAVLLLVAVRRQSWRVPALLANAIQFGLHAISHLLDITEATPHWLGYFDFFALSAGTAVLVLLARSAGRAECREP